MGGESPQGVVANVIDCDIVVSKFELQLRYSFTVRQIKDKGSLCLEKNMSIIPSS